MVFVQEFVPYFQPRDRSTTARAKAVNLKKLCYSAQVYFISVNDLRGKSAAVREYLRNN